MLDAADLIASARARAGLHDLGADEDEVRQGLGVLVHATNNESKLDAEGQARVAELWVSFLAARLGVEEAYRLHPEIEDEVIESVLFVIGLPRTASTALIVLLSKDPEVRVLRTWEAWSPAPPPDLATEGSDPRIAAARERMERFAAAYPTWPRLLPLSADGPNECSALLGLSFRSSVNNAAGARSYLSWLGQCDTRPAYRYHRRVLKLLQWRRPPRRWRLKHPAHIYNLDALLEVYPEARFVVTHRDPAAVVPSMVTLTSIPNWRMGVPSQPRAVPDPASARSTGMLLTELLVFGASKLMEFRSRVGEERFCDVGFSQYTRDPLAAAESIYRFLGEPLSPGARQRMADWVAGNEVRRRELGVATEPRETYGLDGEHIRRRFQPYLERFASFL